MVECGIMNIERKNDGCGIRQAVKGSVMKKLFVILISVCILCSSISTSVMAEDSNIDVVIEEGTSEDLNSDVAFDDIISDEAVIEETTTEETASEENAIVENTIEEDSLKDSSSEDVNPEKEDNNIISTVEPAHPSEISFFGLRYSDEQKAENLRDFLVERLSNINMYQDELTLGEYSFDNSGASDVLFVDLSNFADFEMYANSENIDSTKEIISIAIKDIQNKYPRLFWVENYYCCKFKTSNYKVTRIGLKLNCYTNFNINKGLQQVINKVDSLTADFDNYVQSIINLIPDSYSDYEKVLFVNDYFCTNYKYDTSYSIYNAYDLFKKGTGVCQAYTLAFMAVMDELGIECDSVPSKEMNHIWNIVELNGKWYHIDVTWNDPYWETYDIDTLGRAEHKYFLLSSEGMQNKTPNHYGFDVDSYGYEFGTEFDETDVNLQSSLASSFINLNGTWYNTGYNSTDFTCGLYSFDSPDISTITNDDLKTPLYNIGQWGQNGSFSYLSKYKDTILYNTPTSIGVFDGNEFAELYVPERANNKKIYGFDIKDNTIRVQLATSPTKSGMKNAILQTANIIDVVYMDYDGTILAEGFAVEGAEVPDLFIPDAPVRESEGKYKYTFDKWVTDDGMTFIAEYTKTLKEGFTLSSQEGITISSIPNNIIYGDDGFKINISATEETPDLGAFEFAIVDENGNTIENSKVAAVDPEGNVSIKAAGTTYIKVSRSGNEDYADFEQFETLVVAPKEIIITPTSGLSKYEGQEDVELTYTFDNNEIINPEKDIISGTLSRAKGEEPGVYNFTLGTLKINDNYKLVLPETAVTFEVKAKLNQDVIVGEINNSEVCYGNTLKLSVSQKQTDAVNEFIFSSSNEKIATVDEEGNITFVGVGEAKITISNAGNYKYNKYVKELLFNVSKREIILSDIDFNKKTAIFTNTLEADTTLNLDFNKLVSEVIGVCEEDNTKYNVKAINLILSGERAEFYNLATEQFNCTVANTNIIDVNPKADNGSVSGIGKYLANSEVKLTATANSNFKFDGWYRNETLISTAVTYTFNTSVLEGVEARFSPINDDESNDGFSGGGAGGSTAGSSGGGGGGAGGGSASATKPSTNTDKTEENEKKENNKEEEKGSSEEIVPVVWSNPFIDVKKDAWYYADVKNIIEKKLMTGTADDTFSPDAATTRGMIVTILYRLEGEPLTDINNVFDDVDASDYYSKAIAWAVANGIVNGVGDGKFAPNDKITREQFAAILYRYASYKNLDVTLKAKLDNFSDNKEISTWAMDAITWANTNGIITGTSATTISPQNGAVRAQAAAMLNRFINLSNK